jgi:PhnB protein
MIQRYLRPRGALAPFVECLWLYEGYVAGHAKERTLPTGTAELVINLHEDTTRIEPRDAARGMFPHVPTTSGSQGENIMEKKKVRFVPEGHNVVSPYLTVSNAERVIAFAKTTFGADLLFAHKRPDGAIGHAELRIGDSVVMVGQAEGSSKARSPMIHVYVEDCDATYERALAAGATSITPPATQVYGDRSAGVEDAEGTTWWIATCVEEIAADELDRRVTEMYAKRKSGG